jgi:hypothetical protein
MRRLVPVLAALVLAPLASARAEEEAATYDLHTWRVVWKAGDTATVKRDDSTTSALEITQPGREGASSTQKQEHVSHDVSTYVVKCLEATEEGVLTKALVFVSEWSHEGMSKAGEKEVVQKPESSLKGLHLEVTVKDGVHAYRILTQDARPSREGREWLEKQFGSQQRAKWLLDLDHLGRPEGPVKVGDSWKGDPLNLKFPMPLDPKESTLKLTLHGVTDGRMRLPGEMRFRLTGFPWGPAVLPFTEGGVLEGDSTLTHSLAPHTFDCDGTFLGSLKGTAALGEIKVVMELGHASTLQSKTGGEMPKPPGEKPAEKPADAPK